LKAFHFYWKNGNQTKGFGKDWVEAFEHAGHNNKLGPDFYRQRDYASYEWDKQLRMWELKKQN